MVTNLVAPSPSRTILDAKFIHIHRNPIEVFLSTQNFYNKMLPPLQLQSISKEEIDLKYLYKFSN